MGPWPIPSGFDRLVRDYIRQKSGDDRDYLSAYEFAQGQAVRLSFEDGSFAYFECAFVLNDPERELVAVFTEHCGYHVFSSTGLSVEVLRRIDERIPDSE